MAKLSKKQQEAYKEAYFNSTKNNIYQAYTRPSIYKINAEEKILQKMLEKNGKNYRILGYNSCTFTCAFEYPDEQNGNLWLQVETRSNTYNFEL